MSWTQTGPYKLWNPFIKSVKYGDLDYSADELVDIELGIRYDWAELSYGPTIEGADVGIIKAGTIENPSKFFTTERETPES